MDPKVENGGSQEYGVSGWGKSLQILSIQKIIRNDPKAVLKDTYRNTRTGHWFQISHQLPSKFQSYFFLGSLRDEEERRKFDLACKDWGFFLVNLGNIIFWSSAIG